VSIGRLSRADVIAPCAIAVLALLVYANALHNGFALDDEGIVLHNALVHHADGWWRAFISPYWPNGAGQYRPLVIAGFSLEWALWGAHPAGYHAVNMVLHAGVCVLVYTLLRRRLSLGWSAMAAAVFAVHPVHVEAVANVVGRGELMAACGVLAMLLLHERRSRWALVAFAAALLSKEHALLAPLLAIGLDVVSRRKQPDNADGASQRNEARGAVITLYAGYAAIAIAWGIAVAVLFRNRPFASVDPFWTGQHMTTRALTLLGIVPVWVRLWFVPFDLSSDYSPRMTAAWPADAASAMLGASIILLVVAAVLAGRRRAPWMGIAVAWMGVTMAPVANVMVPTGVIVAERTMYLSSVGAVLLIGGAGEWLAQRSRPAAVALVVLIVAAFGVRTWTRTPVWKSNRDLFVTTVATHPEASWTHVLLGRIYVGNGGFQDALREYRIALSLFSRNPVSVAEAVYAAGRAREYGFADSVVARAVVELPGDYLTSVAHAYIALEQHRYDEGLRAARIASTARPDSAPPRFFAAEAWAALHEPDSARAALAHIPTAHPWRVAADSLRATLPRNP
jgi:hypothetical protein